MVGLRYLAMAFTGSGVAAFQQPTAVESFASVWTPLALVVYAGLGWRLVVTARRREPEALAWLFALASFAPVSQVFPFVYPVADRYLYFIAPGLFGALALAGSHALADDARARRTTAVVAAVAIVASLGFATQSFLRARIWRGEPYVLADSERHYPDGLTAHLLAARRYAKQGEPERAAASLGRARERGFNGLSQVLNDPVYRAARAHPAFEAELAALARHWIARFEGAPPTQLGLSALAQAHFVAGDVAAALAALDRGLALGGPLDEALRRTRDAMARRAEERDGGDR